MFNRICAGLLFAAVLPFILAACGSAGSPGNPLAGPLGIRQALAAIKGEFSSTPGRDGIRYSKQQDAVDTVLEQTPGARRDNLPEDVLAQLVDCLDDASPSSSVFADQPSPLGWVCYATLTGFVYHEETDEQGDITSWAGYPELPASSQAMQTAKSAWQRVLADQTYAYY
ncbi:MAG: hypothetical protein LBE59_04575 [Nevskiaceae bacterium]|nr:hypothetical protein [Nevskiaceae bacterium]